MKTLIVANSNFEVAVKKVVQLCKRRFPATKVVKVKETQYCIYLKPWKAHTDELGNPIIPNDLLKYLALYQKQVKDAFNFEAGWSLKEKCMFIEVCDPAKEEDSAANNGEVLY